MLNLTARSFVDEITSFPLTIGLLLARSHHHSFELDSENMAIFLPPYLDEK